jgi:hypothetical protein
MQAAGLGEAEGSDPLAELDFVPVRCWGRAFAAVLLIRCWALSYFAVRRHQLTTPCTVHAGDVRSAWRLLAVR